MEMRDAAPAAARLRVPPLATDCHMHVFGPIDRYPAAPLRSYTPRPAPLSAWRDVADALGLRRAVVVQASAYGVDNSCVVDVLRELGPLGRGIAQIDDTTSDREIADLHAAGVRGVRLNAKSVGQRNIQILRDAMMTTARRIAPFGWHLQLHTELTIIGDLFDTIVDAPIPVVLDHMGGAHAHDNLVAVSPLLSLLAKGRCWVKLSGAYRASRLETGFEDAIPLAQLLIRANPDRVIWGTDWPHTAVHAGVPGDSPPPIAFRTVDAKGLIEGLAEASGDQAMFDQILVTNPARLYGFEDG